MRRPLNTTSLTLDEIIVQLELWNTARLDLENDTVIRSHYAKQLKTIKTTVNKLLNTN